MALIVPPDVLTHLASMPKTDRDRLLRALEMVAAAPTKRFSFVTEMVGNRGVWRLPRATGEPYSEFIEPT